MTTFNIKPKVAEQAVLDPQTHEPLSPDGEEKPRNTYWLRRIFDGDVVEVSAEKHKKEA